mgnify:CR=1 FL=1
MPRSRSLLRPANETRAGHVDDGHSRVPLGVAQPSYLWRAPLLGTGRPKRGLDRVFLFFVFFLTDDVFSIDELMVYEGESNDKTYAVAGEILDGVSALEIHSASYSINFFH